MTLRKILLASTALGAAAMLAGPAFAGSAGATQNEIDTLKTQMEMLQQKLNDLQIQTASDIKTLKGGDATVSLKGGKFSVKSNDGQYAFNISGRAHFDMASADTDSGLIKYNNGANFRRAEIGASGFFMKDWHYGVAFQFGGSGAESAGLKEAVLSYEGIDNLALQIGGISLPLTLDYATSSNDITFIERPAAVNMMIGLGSDDGRSAVGATYTSASEKFFGMLYYTKDRPGTDATTGAEGDNIVGRFAMNFAPMNDSVLHLGASGTYATHVKGNAFSLGDRPGVRVDNIQYINTGTISNIESAKFYGPEAAFAVGPFRTQGEYYRYDISRKTGGSDITLDSWYVQASYILTGESYKYKPGVAAFKGVSPDAPLGKGGFGAWEIAARYGDSDLQDLGAGVNGGKEKLTTVGLNWYPNTSVRFMLNYIHGDESANPNAKSGSTTVATTGGNVDIVALRTQFAF